MNFSLIIPTLSFMASMFGIALQQAGSADSGIATILTALFGATGFGGTLKYWSDKQDNRLTRQLSHDAEMKRLDREQRKEDNAETVAELRNLFAIANRNSRQLVQIATKLNAPIEHNAKQSE